MREINLKINGKFLKKKIKDNILLVDFLREDLNLTGTHVGCDTSQCGACNIHLNGKVIKSCAIFVYEAENCEITTIEGVANNDGSLNYVQKAFQDNHGLQCGFCTPGMVMSILDLLKDNKNPTDFEIKKHLEGNFCRCTGYNNIIKTVKKASKYLEEN